MLVVMVAVVAIPTIYTTLFLGSMWDPYGSVDRLPVAVVNEDRPVEYKGETLSVGCHDADYVAFLKLTFHGSHPHHQQACRSVGAERAHRFVVDAQCPFGEAVAVGEPFLHPRHTVASGQERGVRHALGLRDELSQDVLPSAVGNDYAYTLVGYLARYAAFRSHSTAPRAAP